MRFQCHLTEILIKPLAPFFCTFWRLSYKGSVLRLLLFMVANDFKVTASPYVTLCRVVVVKSLSCVQFFVTRWTATHQAPLSSTISWSLLKFMSIELVVLSNHLILCHSLLLLLSIFSIIKVFSIAWACQGAA